MSYNGKKGYGMVRAVLEYRFQEVYGVWVAHTTLPSNVYFTYRYQGEFSSAEEPSEELYDLLHELSSKMGVWEEDGDEDI